MKDEFCDEEKKKVIEFIKNRVPDRKQRMYDSPSLLHQKNEAIN
jgi:hypothetical protein